MAGDWIKWTKGLPNKPEVIRMATALRISREAVVCRLMQFWEWCDENVADCDVRETGSAFVKLSPDRGDNVAVVDSLVRTPGFADSLAVVGWIKFRDDLIELPNFGRHNGETAKTRARNAKNQQRKRQSDTPQHHPGAGGVVTERSPGMSPPAGDIPVTRGEERREKKEAAPSERSPRTKPPPKPRPRNPLFDAVAEVTGSDPVTAGAHVGKVAALLAKADPPYTPEDVMEFGRRFLSICTYATGERDRPTLGEIEKNIGRLRAGPSVADPPPAASTRRGFQTHDERVLGILGQLARPTEDDGG